MLSVTYGAGPVIPEADVVDDVVALRDLPAELDRRGHLQLLDVEERLEVVRSLEQLRRLVGRGAVVGAWSDANHERGQARLHRRLGLLLDVG